MGDYTAFLDPTVFNKYMELDQHESLQAEYVWVGGNGMFRCKTMTLSAECKNLEDYRVWNFDGSSTNQATGEKSEVHLKPACVIKDPFRKGNNVIVLCECVLMDQETGKFTPHPTNKRDAAAALFKKPEYAAAKWWFGIEQEYTLFYDDCRTPFGWPRNGYPQPQGPFYCSIGTQNAYGRRIAEAHYRCCLFSQLKISGINAEVMAGQWEYQIGPCEGIESGDHHTLSRYLLHRVCEDFGVVCSFHPKPIPGDWNGAGCHTNCSSLPMRVDNGIEVIENAVLALGKKHKLHIDAYGTDNHLRLTGAHETASIHEFSSGIGNRGCSIRIPTETGLNKKGYFEDRRPASNMNPYVVTALIAETCTKGVDDDTSEISPN